MGLDKSIFTAFCHCNFKAFLKASEVVGEPTEYEIVQTEADDEFKDKAIERLLRENKGAILRLPPSSPLVSNGGNGLVLGAQIEGLGITLTYDVIEMHEVRHESQKSVYVPVLFSHKSKLAREDSILAALHGIVLAEAIGQPVPIVKLLHGPSFSVTRIKLNSPSGPTRLAPKQACGPLVNKLNDI